MRHLYFTKFWALPVDDHHPAAPAGGIHKVTLVISIIIGY